MRGHASRRRRAVVGAAACGGLVVVLLLVAAHPAAASTLTSRFAIDGGADYARHTRVVAGDGGWSAFFAPGVVVWDGGSIVAGHAASPGMQFPAQTLAMLAHVCRSTVSASGNALLSDMILEGPAEVDARYRVTADLNVCVVLGGGGDFRGGRPAAQVFDLLQAYCLARRAAGFRVVVLTVLPRSQPVTFEASRLAFDQMIRDNWPAFADGLADIGADPRIGETGDNLDAQFYGDGVHPNDAGNLVMASVAAPVLGALPWASDGCEMRLRDEAAAWGDWRPYAARVTLDLLAIEGLHIVQAQYRLGGETVDVSDTIFVDTIAPRVVGLRATSVRRGEWATLRYEIRDAPPCGPAAAVTVAVQTLGGKAVLQFPSRLKRIGEPQSRRFVCRLSPGVYRYVVKARDSAGNPQRAVASAGLIVR